MNTETFAQTSFGKLFVKLLASGMESKFRYRYFPPLNIIKGAGMESGQSVLEIGCGTGFFTIPTAKLIGDKGSLTAIDILQGSVDLVSQKVKDADLKNVRVIKCKCIRYSPGFTKFSYCIAVRGNTCTNDSVKFTFN